MSDNIEGAAWGLGLLVSVVAGVLIERSCVRHDYVMPDDASESLALNAVSDFQVIEHDEAGVSHCRRLNGSPCLDAGWFWDVDAGTPHDYGRGGNLIFAKADGPQPTVLSSGAGYAGRGISGSILFQVGGETVMRLEPDGAVFVHGKKVANDREVFLEFKSWLSSGDCWTFGDAGKR